MMKRKEYQNPTVKIVVLTHRTCLLSGSGDTEGHGGASTQDYNVNEEIEI